jgi:hypothetical protein
MFRNAFVAVFMIATMTGAQSQPCNPAIDGTYCADVQISNAARSASAQSMLGQAMSPGPFDQPAKLGAITFGGGSSCIGLLRRVSCN